MIVGVVEDIFFFFKDMFLVMLVRLFDFNMILFSLVSEVL